MSNPLEKLITSNDHIACKEGTRCKSSPSFSSKPLCNTCRLSPAINVFTISKEHHWKPTQPGYKHPILEQEKRDYKHGKAIARAAEKKAKDPARQQINKAAARAEKRTEREIIKSTKNSGRSNKDGDHVSKGKFAMDTKLQSTRDNPIVNLSELDKIRSQAKANGLVLGALVIRNSAGRGVIVIDERDWGLL